MKAIAILMALLFFLRGSAPARADSDEPVAVVELGGATGRNLGDARWSGGADFAIEITPIENCLELEAGTTPLFSRGSTEWDTDLLFKKPWTLSKKLEFMAGVGPAWVHSRQNRVSANSVAGEIVVDLMFWPSANHRIGCFVEPGYEYNFGAGHERSIGVSFGLLIGIHKR